jgi:flagellar biogenesis protein FliO
MSASMCRFGKRFGTGLLSACFAALGLLPSQAQALRLDDVTFTSDPADIIITVRGDETPTTPTVKNYDGEVRIRFPEARVLKAMSVPGDGRALASIELRAGSSGTGVVTLDLADETKLADRDVRVETRKNATVFRIARDLLPPLKETVAAPVPTVEPPLTAASRSAAETSPPLVKAPAISPLTQNTPVPTAVKKSDALSSALASNASPYPLLITISVLLGLAYLALRVFMRKQNLFTDNPTIEVVAQKRIGARHQLMIVRAFGQDHLLSIQGATTTPIASTDVGEESASLDNAARMLTTQKAEPERTQPPEVAPVQATEVSAPEPRITQKPRSGDVSRDESAMFGGELLRLAIAQKQRTSMLPRAKPSVQSRERSERAPVEEPPASRPERSERLSRAAAQPPANRAAPRRDDQALSKAVAGLVRMRREAR